MWHLISPLHSHQRQSLMVCASCSLQTSGARLTDDFPLAQHWSLPSSLLNVWAQVVRVCLPTITLMFHYDFDRATRHPCWVRLIDTVQGGNAGVSSSNDFPNRLTNVAKLPFNFPYCLPYIPFCWHGHLRASIWAREVFMKFIFWVCDIK